MTVQGVWQGAEHLSSTRGALNKAAAGANFQSVLCATQPQTLGKGRDSISMLELSDQQVSSLSGKYDFTNLSQDEYDSFLDYLKDEGFLTQEDLRYLGYGGIMVCGGSGSYSLPDTAGLEHGSTNLRLYAQTFSKAENCVLANGQPDRVAQRQVALLGKLTHLLKQIPMER